VIARIPEFPAPPPDAGVFQPFWDAVAQDRLALPRCHTCGHWVWYPTPRCPKCGGAQIQWTPLGGTGTLFTYTVVHRAFLSGVPVTQPFVTGLVELDGAPGARLVANVDAAPEKVEVGMRLRVRFETAGGRRRPVFEPEEAPASPPA
jgi:uncharacterized OB-fold protein